MTLEPEPGPPPNLPPLPPTPLELAAAVARLETRVAALEDAAGVLAPDVSDELAKLAWAVKHGRQRPW